MITTPAQRTAGLIRARKALGLTARRRPMPRDRFPTLVAMEYTRALWRLYERVRPAFADLFAALPRILESAKAQRGDAETRYADRMIDQWNREVVTPILQHSRFDAGEGREVRDLVQRARENMNQSIDDNAIEAVAEEFVTRTSTEQRKMILKQTRAAFGVEVPTTDAGIAGTLQAHVQANVGLIKDVADETARKIEAVVLAGVQDGRLVGDLQGDIRKVFAAGEERLQLIAVDQVGKAYSDVTYLRHQELGVRKFRWRTSRDSRVRGNPGGKYPKAIPSHWAREGKIYSYDNLPKGAGGQPERPGKPVRCRCTAEPDFDDILEGLDEEPIPSPTLPAQRTIPAKVGEARPRKPKALPADIPEATIPKPVKKAVHPMRAHFGRLEVTGENVGRAGDRIRTATTGALRERYGLHRHDEGFEGNSIFLGSDDGAAAAHHWDGAIELSPRAASRYAAAVKNLDAGKSALEIIDGFDDGEAQIDAIGTLWHEEIHGHGPQMIKAYEGIGVVIEESVTEVAARRVLRDQFGLPLASGGGAEASDEELPFVNWGAGGGTYGHFIIPIRKGLEGLLAVDAVTAYRVLEETALAYKRTAGELNSPEEALDLFVDRLQIDGTDEYKQEVRDKMRTYMKAVWP